MSKLRAILLLLLVPKFTVAEHGSSHGASLRNKLEKRDNSTNNMPPTMGSIAEWFSGTDNNDTKAFTAGSFATGSGPIPDFGFLSPSNGLSAVFDAGNGETVNVTWDHCASQWQAQVGVWTYLNGTEDANATWWSIFNDATVNNASYGGTVAQALYTATLQNLNTFINDANQVINTYVCNDTYTTANSSTTDVVPSDIDVNINTELRRLLADEGVSAGDQTRSAIIFIGINLGLAAGASAISWLGNIHTGFTYQNAVPGLVTAWVGIGGALAFWLAVKTNRQMIQRLMAAAATAYIRHAGQVGVELAAQVVAANAANTGATTAGDGAGNNGAVVVGGGGRRRRDLSCSSAQDVLDAANNVALINYDAFNFVPFGQAEQTILADASESCAA